jgi:hypothetical protein
MIQARPRFQETANLNFTSALEVKSFEANKNIGESLILHLFLSPFHLFFLSGNPCPLLSGNNFQYTKKFPSNITAVLDTITFQCNNQPANYMAPSILVTANFTILSQITNGSADAVLEVFILNSLNTSDVVRRNAAPILLMPGMNTVGSVRQQILRKFRYPRLSTLGIFTVSRFP